jgi:aspartyl-tRNA(Asn)/glutamyl-tRNA(Gln) amidotransferase subunit B
MPYDVVIGLEVHTQLLTDSKMFCGCSASYAGAPPNTHVCPVCLALPGVLPVINKKAVEYSMMAGMALNCSVMESTKFDRKNYFYPDLMKGYQISQYDAPLSRQGWLEIDSGGKRKRIGITRVHLEEDVAKMWHKRNELGETYSLVDVNRAGVPLMEIVSEPEMTTPDEARDYLMKLRTIVQYLGISTGNMEEGSFRCDANISLRPRGSKEFLAKTEVKNMNSFRGVHRALTYEAERQEKVLDSGARLIQETRGWLDEKGITVSQRSKEYAHDYRYFPEPDLPPLTCSSEWVELVRSRLPELPEARRDRFVAQLGLSTYDASLLTATKAMADYFEKCLKLVASGAGEQKLQAAAKRISNWLLSDFSRLLNATYTDIGASRISPENMVELVVLIEDGKLSGPASKAVFEEMFASGKRAGRIMAESGLAQIGDADQVKGAVRQVVAANPGAVSDFRAGKEPALQFLTGQVMKATRGRANPKMVREILLQELGGK